MTSEDIEYKFITAESADYSAALKLRQDVFLRQSGAKSGAVKDRWETRSKHLVAVLGQEVVGYIRITVEGRTAQLSQFVVAPRMQGKANIARNLYTKATAKAKQLGAKKISGEIRLPMAGIASRMGYDVSNGVSSDKSGIPHKYAEKEL